MTVRADIAGVQGNDLVFTFSLAYDDAPLNLAGYTPTVVVKASAAAADGTGTTYTTSSGLTILSSRAGRVKLLIPRANTATPGSSWYRLDVSTGSTVSTVMEGILYIQAA